MESPYFQLTLLVYKRLQKKCKFFNSYQFSVRFFCEKSFGCRLQEVYYRTYANPFVGGFEAPTLSNTAAGGIGTAQIQATTASRNTTIAGGV